MKEKDRWDEFIDWLDFVVLRKLGLIRLKKHEIVTDFFQDWLIDIAKKEPISEQEKSSILAMDRAKEKSNDG